MSDTEPIRDASGEVIGKVLPYRIVLGEDEMTGRAPLNRYGGEKISAFG
jgi:hypothetical protein